MSRRLSYVGIDVHERESEAAVLRKDGSFVEERRIPTKELSSFLLSLPGEKVVAMEAVGFVYPIYDELSSLKGVQVKVANPNRLKLICGTGTKNDKNDARILGDLLRTDYLPLAHMRDEKTRAGLSVVHERVRYGAKRAELRGSIKWLLKRKGIEVERPFGSGGRERLKELCIQEVDDRLAELDVVDSLVAKLDRQIAMIAQGDANARLLDTLPGVSPYTALYLACVLDDIERFPDSKHACAYLGLVPWLDESADVTHMGHITKRGDKWLRRNLVECAAVAVRRDPSLNAFYTRVRRKRGEKRARIAVARKLVSYAYWMIKRNQTYEELNPCIAS